MPHQVFSSWGRIRRTRHEAVRVSWRTEPLEIPTEMSALPYGLGRSYGDSCLNDGGALLMTRGLDRFISFDGELGIVRCEAGVSLAELLALVVPRGWFLRVTPGTKYVTIGGAIANDVHGKNHHREGTFGRHVRQFELLRSDGTRRICSPTENADWYSATIGGLGLTGLVTWAELSLRPIVNAFIELESVRFGGIDEFFDVNRESEQNFEHTVAWIDALAPGARLGRGHYLRGNHAPPLAAPPRTPRALQLPVPFELSSSTLNRFVVRGFNAAYFHRQRRRLRQSLVHFNPFFYPLDAIGDWNRLYGRRGFFQYQCVVPFADGAAIVRELLTTIGRSHQASFMAVLKSFGTIRSPGWLSFPRPGFTIAIDFPNRGDRTRTLFDRLDAIVCAAGGGVYPAKDARMSSDTFCCSFPEWKRITPYLDPGFSSNFWRRVAGAAPIDPTRCRA
jgi:FAD/FMN-containing dehydrogenase